MSLGLWLTTLLLVGLCVECARESGIIHHAFGMRASYRFAMSKPWWTSRKSHAEQVEHARRWHIDLLGRRKKR